MDSGSTTAGEGRGVSLLTSFKRLDNQASEESGSADVFVGAAADRGCGSAADWQPDALPRRKIVTHRVVERDFMTSPPPAGAASRGAVSRGPPSFAGWPPRSPLRAPARGARGAMRGHLCESKWRRG